GRTSRSIQWHVTLMPKRSGVIEIPSIKIDNQQSQPLRLTVNKGASTASSDSDQDLFIKLETSPENIYVQQQILFTINLFFAQDSGLNIAQGSTLSEPELETGDAVIKKLGEDSDFQTTHNGRPYRVIQRRYAVFPQQSGKVTFKPVVFEGHMIQQSRNRFRMFDPFQQQGARIKRIQSRAVELDIKAIPTQFSGQTWLPASKVQLVEDWPEVNKDWYAGEPLTRTLALFVDGLTSAQLPTIDATTPADVKQYPDQPILKDTMSDSGFSGIRQEKIALIPSHAGSFTFPPVKLHWWNTETNQQETATLPARTVTILPARGHANNPVTLPVTPAPEAAIQSDHSITNDADNDKVTPLPLSNSISANWWPWIALVSGCGWLLTLLAWWKQHQTTPRTQNTVSTTNNNEKPIRSQIKQACTSNSATQAKQSLLDWAACIWPEDRPVSLGAIAQRVDHELKEQLMILNQSLYSKQPNNWQGGNLWQAFKNYQPEKNKNGSLKTLSPLYPDH
ncbi:MAG: BatD family protein, partial [Gammaproteobacteria bacterium]|nr:BatD family protein [Gammaproteobacteria bacterium]